MSLSARARAWQGQTVRVREGLGIVSMSPTFHIVRRTAQGEQGVVTSVSDAGFNGLVLRVRLANGGSVNAYVRTDLVGA